MKSRMVQCFALLVGMTWLWLVTQPAHSTLVVADFNDVSIGPITNVTGGTGFTTSKWQFSGEPEVVAGNLTSPFYHCGQTGTAQRVQTINASLGGGDCQVGRTLSTPLIGTVWFSFLAQLADTNDRVALAFNVTSNRSDNATRDGDFVFVGSSSAGDLGQFRVRLGDNSFTVASNLTQNGTSVNLVLGQIIINDPASLGGTNDTVHVWLNRWLTGVNDAKQLPAPDFTTNGINWIFQGAISNIGVVSYESGPSADGGIIDAIRLSDGTSGLIDVIGTGVNVNAVADFNDLTPGSLTSQSGGTGFATSNWIYSSSLQVVSGNLVSPLYKLAQTGIPMSLQSTNENASSGQAGRAFVTPLGGTVWFSFLAELTDPDDRVSFTINPNSASTINGCFDGDFIFVGGDSSGEFRVRQGNPLSSTNVAPNLSQDGSVVYLVLGQIVINDPTIAGMSNDTLRVWFNPKLIGVSRAGELPPPSFSNSINWVSDFGVSAVGVMSYSGTYSSDGGIIDNLHISSRVQGFYDVTGCSPRFILLIQ